MNSGARFFSTLITVVTASALHCTAQAATLEYYSGTMRAQADSCIEDPCIPRLHIHQDTQSVAASSMAATFSDPSYADGFGDGYVEYSNAGVLVELAGAAFAGSDDSGGKSVAYGNAKTVQPNYTEGMFFKVTAQGAELSGEAVQISYDWLAYADASSEGWGVLSGGTYSDTDIDGNPITITKPMAITLNGAEAWSHVVISDYGLDVDETETGVFMAAIDDIIGVHLLAGAFASINGEGYAEAFVENSMELTIANVPIPAAIWLFGTGLLGLFGAARISKGRISTAPIS